MFDKEQFRKEMLEAVEPRMTTAPRLSLGLAVFALFFILLLGWVTADILSLIHI